MKEDRLWRKVGVTSELLALLFPSRFKSLSGDRVNRPKFFMFFLGPCTQILE
jgi:hypothetical protein